MSSLHRLSALLLVLACPFAGRTTEPGAEAASTSAAPAPSPDGAEHGTAPQTSLEEELVSLLKLGASLTERSDFAAAAIAYHQVLKSTAASAEQTKSALLGLARMHRKEGALTKAVAVYERFLKDHPGDARSPEALLDLGRTQRDMGAHRLAISRFYSVINSTLKLPEEGFDHYQQLAKTAQYEIAETHFQSGNFEEANRFFSRLRLLDLAPEDRARAHFKAAYAQHLGGDAEGTVRTLRAYLEQWPDDENVPEARHLLAGNLRTLRRPQEAFAVTLDLLRAEKARVDTDPKRWAYWQRRTGNQLANEFFQNGDPLNAMTLYAALAALSDEPSWNLPVSYQLALCHERLGMTERAVTTYRRIEEAVDPATMPHLAELARMAAWRRSHLDWKENLGQQMTSFFETAPDKQPRAGSNSDFTPAAIP